MAFSQDWFLPNIPVWEQLLAGLRGRNGLRILEIGSFEGRCTCWLLENVLTGHDARIDCVDTFAGSVEHPQMGVETRSLLDTFKENTAAWAPQVGIHVGTSEAVLPTLDAGYDAIYVDGSHTAKDVLTDAVLAWRLLKTGGLLIFDDYEWSMFPQPELNPKLGIKAFLHSYQGWFDTLHVGYQVAVRKRDAYRDPRLPDDLRDTPVK